MLDIRAFALTLLPLLVASQVVLWVNWRIHQRMHGPVYWVAGATIRFFGMAIIAMNVNLPGVLGNVLASFLVVIADYVSLYGLCVFAGRPAYRRTTAVVLSLVFVGLCYYTYVESSPYLRVGVMVFGHIVSIFLLVLVQVRIARQDGIGGILILAISSFWEIFLGPLLILMMFLSSGGRIDLAASMEWVQPMSATAMLGILQTFGFTLLTANRTQRELRQMALLDTLTGVPNRRAFETTMKRSVQAAKRNGTSLGLAVIDLDRFKEANDNYGHAAGDALLRHVATTISSTLRDSDFFARIGGEEFALVVEDTTMEALSEVAERFRLAVEMTPLHRVNDTKLSCTLSAGIALSAPGTADFNSLYAAADAALYRAKIGGRNRVEIAHNV